MPGPKNALDATTSGIPRAVREGAKAADDTVLERTGRPCGPHREDASPSAETAAKTVMARAMESRQCGGADGLARIQRTAAELVRGAGDVDANMIGTVRGAVIGAVEAGRDCGIDERDAASAAAIGAIEGAGEIGEAAVEQVKALVTGPMDTITPIDDATFAKGRRTP